MFIEIEMLYGIEMVGLYVAQVSEWVLYRLIFVCGMGQPWNHLPQGWAWALTVLVGSQFFDDGVTVWWCMITKNSCMTNPFARSISNVNGSPVARRDRTPCGDSKWLMRLKVSSAFPVPDHPSLWVVLSWTFVEWGIAQQPMSSSFASACRYRRAVQDHGRLVDLLR